MKRVIRVLGGFLGLVLFASTMVTAGPAKLASAQADVDTTMLLFDLSSSMGQSTVDGRSRLAVAQDAMISAIGGLDPGSKNIGIRTFSNCGVSNLVAPPGPVDKVALAATISSFRLGSLTDISLALEGAAADLAGQPGRHTVILLSDGQQTCTGDPCATAQALVASGVDVLINAIGIGTSGTSAEEQLRCIAGATGGTVVSVDNASDLFDAIDTAIGGEPTAGLISFPTPICINSPMVQADASLAAATVGSTYNDATGAQRILTAGAACGFYCEDGFDANCDGVLGDFCPSDVDATTVAGAGKCLEQLGDTADPTEEVDENGNPTTNAILAYGCVERVKEIPQLAPDMVAPCEQYLKGVEFEGRADAAGSVGDAFLEDWNEQLADAAVEEASKILDAAMAKFIGQGRTYREAVRRIITGADLGPVTVPDVPQYPVWQELQAFPLLGATNRSTVLPVAFQPNPVPAALQASGQDWDCDQARFRDSQTNSGFTRLEWDGPRGAEIYASTLFRIDTDIPEQVERTAWPEEFMYFFSPLDPSGEYAVVVTAEGTQNGRPDWLGTCLVFVGANKRQGSADELDLDPVTGAATLELEYIRALGERLSFHAFAQLLIDNFAEISGNDRKIQIGELRTAFTREDLPEEVRAAAVRGIDNFDWLDVAQETDLGERLRLLRTGVPGGGDGDVSREDLRDFPDKFAALVVLAPWLVVIDTAGDGDGALDAWGWLEGAGRISPDDVVAFAEMEAVDVEVRAISLVVFAGLSESFELDFVPLLGGDAANAAGLFTISFPLTITFDDVDIATKETLRQTLRQQVTQLKGQLRTAARRAAPFASFWVGWEIGSELRERYDAEPPTDIQLIDPFSGRTGASVPIEVLDEYPPHLRVEIIETFARTGELPDTEEDDENENETDTDEDNDNCSKRYPDEERIRLANVALAEARRINLRSEEVPEPNEVNSRQTVSVLVVCDQTTLETRWFVAGGRRNLTAAQQTFAREVLGIIPFAPTGDTRHAEPKVLDNGLANPNVLPMAIAATNAFCPPEQENCRALIQDVAGATVLQPDNPRGTAERRAYWPAGVG